MKFLTICFSEFLCTLSKVASHILFHGSDKHFCIFSVSKKKILVSVSFFPVHALLRNQIRLTVINESLIIYRLIGLFNSALKHLHLELSRCASCVARCIPPCDLCAYFRNPQGQTISSWILVY